MRAGILDRQAIADFLAYDQRHERRVDIVTDPALADWHTWPGGT